MNRTRSPRTALAALAVTIAAVAGVYLWLDILPGLPAQRDVVVGVDAVEISNQTLTLGPAEWSEFEAPEGSRTLSIRLRASGGADAEMCGRPTLTEPATERVWVSSRSGLDVPYDEGESSCLAESEPYAMLVVFLLPDDATGPFELDFDGDDGDTARFIVEP